MTGPEPSTPPIPFIVGVPRSGTTLLRLMLDSHPALAIPPETQFIPDAAAAWRASAEPLPAVLEAISAHRFWGDLGIEVSALRERLASNPPLSLAEVLRMLFSMYAEGQGKPRWGDKSTNHLAHLALIAELLPEVHFVHIIRDGRDVYLSTQGLWFGPSTPHAAAAQWRREIQTARQQAPNNYLEIRYEELVASPEPTLRSVCGFLALPWDEGMLRYHERAPARLEEVRRDTSLATGRIVSGDERVSISQRTAEPLDLTRISRWRDELSDRDQSQFVAVAGDLLERLGYPT